MAYIEGKEDGYPLLEMFSQSREREDSAGELRKKEGSYSRGYRESRGRTTFLIMNTTELEGDTLSPRLSPPQPGPLFLGMIF